MSQNSALDQDEELQEVTESLLKHRPDYRRQSTQEAEDNIHIAEGTAIISETTVLVSSNESFTNSSTDVDNSTILTRSEQALDEAMFTEKELDDVSDRGNEYEQINVYQEQKVRDCGEGQQMPEIGLTSEITNIAIPMAIHLSETEIPFIDEGEPEEADPTIMDTYL